MAIHYDAKLKRFRDDSGKLVSRQRAWRSSTARAEFAKAQKVSHAKPKTKKPQTPLAAVSKKAAKKAPAKTAAKVPRKGAKKKAKKRIFPWDVEGVIREYPEPQDWFPDIEEPDYDYGYDDLIEDWGDFEDEDTTS